MVERLIAKENRNFSSFQEVVYKAINMHFINSKFNKLLVVAGLRFLNVYRYL